MNTDETSRNLSYSGIMRYGFRYNGKRHGCPYSYYLHYLLSIESTKADSKYRRFGEVVHKILQSFYPSINLNNVPQRPQEYFYLTLANLLSNMWDYSLTEQQYKDAIQILKFFSEMESARFINYIGGVIPKFMPLYCELEITEPYNIKIDRVFPDHGLMDYKTTKYMPTTNLLENLDIKYILQAGIYAISYYRKFGIWPPRMVYYFLRFNLPIVVPIDQWVLDTTVRITNIVIDNINGNRFPKNSENCQWCDMRHVCGLEEIEIVRF